MEMNMASVASSRVAGMRSRIRCIADSPVRKLFPKSSWTALARKIPYCCQRGRSKPRLRRMASRSRSVASGLAIISTGSPIRYSAANTSADMTRTTSPVCRTRRSMVASTLATSRWATSWRRLDILGQGHLVGTPFIANVVLHGPDGHLELQGKDAVVFHDHAAGFLQQPGPLVIVKRTGGLQHQFVGLRIRILAPIGGAQAQFRLLGHYQRV